MNTYTTEELISDVDRVSKVLGYIPAYNEYRKHGKYCPGTVRYRFGSWEDVKRALGWVPPEEDGWAIDCLAPEDGGWLAGIFAADGCFTMSPVSGSNYSRFTISAQISLRKDDIVTLEEIKRLWQLQETITQFERLRGRRSPIVQLKITNTVTQYRKVVPTFEKYSLRGRKKQDFELFTQAAQLMYGRIEHGRFGHTYTDEEREKLKYLYHALQEVKRYNGIKKGLDAHH